MITKDLNFKRPEEFIGTQLGKYRIDAKLGRGGKGIVFKAYDTLEEKRKAIKLIPPEIADSPLAFTNLKREFRHAVSISHPNVVKVLSLEEHRGLYCIVMEFIDGVSLEQKLAEEEKLEETEVIKLMRPVAQGLEASHRTGILHRDIKPANIMIDVKGRVKILDFGISYQMNHSMTQLVGNFNPTGTWPYMAPEQLSNQFGKEDKQVDVWGFGATMYHLLTGERPFRRKDMITDEKETPFEPEDISPKTRDVVLKCLEKNRQKRFQNMVRILTTMNATSPAVHINIPTKENTTAKDRPVNVDAVAQRGIPVEKNSAGYWEASYTVFDNKVVMVYIPAGPFKMGSNDHENEKPIRDIKLKGYWIGKTVVTMGLYRCFSNDANLPALPEKASQYAPRNSHPVVMVSYNDALAFCRWLETKTGTTFKLPSEAQWEKGARGTDGGKYPWGNHEPFHKGKHYANCEADRNKPGQNQYTTSVGAYPHGASPYGILDMAGNVWEWCMDWYVEEYYKHAPLENPCGPASGSRRVVRGGGWSNVPWGIRSTNRDGYSPTNGYNSLGFRLSQDIK